MKHLIFPAMIALCLGGCGESSDGTASSREPTPPPADDHVWKEQTDTLQKARDAEKMLEDAQAKRQQQLDEATPPH